MNGELLRQIENIDQDIDSFVNSEKLMANYIRCLEMQNEIRRAQRKKKRAQFIKEMKEDSEKLANILHNQFPQFLSNNKNAKTNHHKQ